MKNNLKEIRWKQNLSVLQLSKISGISHSQITKIENGYIKDVTLQTAYKLSSALNVSVYELFPNK